MDDKPGAKPITLEVTPARDGDEFLWLWADGIREPKDPLLQGRGRDLEFYDQVRNDAQVWSTLQQRRDAVASRPWEILPGDESAASKLAAEELEAELRAIDFDQKARFMLWGIFYGYSVAECLWKAEGGRFRLADIKVRRARRFGFDVDGNLMLRPVISRPAEVMPDRKFWVMSAGCDTDDEPYGFGLAHLLYWPSYFKRHGLRAWMTALDKYASPTAFGTFPPGTSPEDQIKLLNGLQAIKQGSALIYQQGMEAGYLQTAKSASGDYNTFDRRLDAWISKIVLSQTMTTDDGASKSQGEVHMDVRDEVARSDAALLSGSFNDGPARWWAEWNHPTAAPPVLRHIMDDEEDMDAASERDERLSRMGYVPSPERVATVYGDGYERHKPSSVPAPTDARAAPLPALASADEADAIGAFVERLMGAEAPRSAATDMLAPIVDLVASARTLEELRTSLGALSLDDASLEPLREELAQAAFAARIGGEVGVLLRDGVEQETL